ncbi:MAG: ATP-grasp domain-containing protein [Planctomycetes bacterium]|nr:ATP-grasp domain-containing protein [Planctomycetota bacterium]
MTTVHDPYTAPLAPEEREAFMRLEARLPDLWRTIHARPDAPHTSVVVPSLSFDLEEVKKIEGAPCYEERQLFSLMRLRHPNARVLYVTSMPVHPEIVEYYLHLLVGVPASHARRRLGELCMWDPTSEPLSRKILRRPRALQRIKQWIGDPSLAYLSCFNATNLEARLAIALGIPLNAADPALLYWGTKSGSRKAFQRAGVAHPAGFEDLRTEDEIVDALLELVARRPELRRAVVKLDASFSGEGNAIFSYPPALPEDVAARRGAVRDALFALEFSAPGETTPTFLEKLEAMGGIVEEFVPGDEVRSPSVQMRVTPLGETLVISTHDQVLGGSTGQVYIGCRFPADAEYRLLIQAEAEKVGRVLADLGVVSRFGIDFIVTRRAGGPWQAHAIEINLRLGGTTHPFLALQFLTGGTLDPATGCFLTTRGEPRCYFATDTLRAPSYRGLLAEDLMDVLVSRGLQFRPSTETGTLFHMIGALSQFGKVGVTCIGATRAEADEHYAATVAQLDQETGAVQGRGGRAGGLFDHGVMTIE